MKIVKKIMIVFLIIVLFSLNSVYADENTTNELIKDNSNEFITIDNPNEDAPAIAEDIREGIVDDENCFIMIGKTGAGSGYHWEISPESYGVELVSIIDIGSPRLEIDPITGRETIFYGGTSINCFKFHIISDDYYAKLIHLTPIGDICEEKIFTNVNSDNTTSIEQNNTENDLLQENATTQNNSSVMENNTQSTNNTSNNSSVMENTANPLIALLLSCILIPMGIYRKRK